MSAQTRVLPDINFDGAPAYSKAELLAVSGLKPGGSATQEQIEQAAGRLNDTGLFDEVTFSGNSQGLVYKLKPASAKAMLPARFANFVWWPDEEIDRTLRARVPLYRGEAVPIGGNLRESVAAALTAMLAEKGLSGAAVASRLSSLRTGTAPDHIAFEIESPMVLIHSLTLTGASPDMKPRLDNVIHDLAGQEWDKDASYINIAGRVGDVYRDQGYLDITVAKLDRSAPAMTPTAVQVDVTATLGEGAQYHVTQLAWPGSDLLSIGDFNKQAKLKPGDPDSPSALRESLNVLTAAYGAKGYLDAKIMAPPAVDRASHQVAYTIGVVPGPQYRFRSIHWAGVGDPQAKELDAAWRMKTGEIYDSTYFKRFCASMDFAKIIAQNMTPGHQHYNVSINEKRDASALMVDVTVTFSK
jgi:outer membrane protein assembly factor BamA